MALYFFINGHLEEMIDDDNDDDDTVNVEHGGFTMDDWFVWMGLSVEEEAVIRSNFTIIRFFVYFLFFFWFFCLLSSFFSSLF